MVCVKQYLTARFLPYNDMKEQFEFQLLFYLSAEFILSYFLAFPVAGDFFPYSFLSLVIFLLLSYHPTFILDIFNFCFLDKIPNNLFSGFGLGFFFLYVVHSALSHLCHNVLTFLIYSTQEIHTKLWITLVNYPVKSSLQLFQKEQSVTGFIRSLTLCLVHFCIWNFPLQFAI